MTLRDVKIFLRSKVAGLILLSLGLQAAAQDSLVIIKEDFESYPNSEAMRAFWARGTGTLETDPPGGGKCAAHDGADMNRHGGFQVGPDNQNNLVLKADFYDFATNANKRVTVSLRRENGESFDMGVLDPAGYAIRIMGFSNRTNWVSFKKSQLPVAGWHRFEAVISLTNVSATLDLNSDGKVDYAMKIPFTVAPGQFSQVRFGGLSSRPSRGGPILVDNIGLSLVPLTAAQVAVAPATVPVATPPPTPVPVVENRRSNYPEAVWWIFGALTIIIALLFGMLLVLRRSWPIRSEALVGLHSAPALEAPPQLPVSTEEWRQRALKMSPELTEFAKQALVQGLYTQRNALLETQLKAQQALTELEQRLAELQLPAPDRIRAYEQRIAELEQELENRGEELRELTQATLLLVRQKLEQERTAKTPRFN